MELCILSLSFRFSADCSTAGYAILNGTNLSQVLQRSDAPLMSLAQVWERGVAPAQCGTADTLFVTTVRKIPSCSQAFQLLFGGSDAVVGMATISLKQIAVASGAGRHADVC